jgi:hypothetical protein
MEANSYISIPGYLYFGKYQSVKIVREKQTAMYYVLFMDGKKTIETPFMKLPDAISKYNEISLSILAK